MRKPCFWRAFRKPVGYSPYISEKKAKQRQKTILRLMTEQKMISKAKAENLKKAPLAYKPLKTEPRRKRRLIFTMMR